MKENQNTKRSGVKQRSVVNAFGKGGGYGIV